MAGARTRVVALHLGLIAALFAAQFALGEYHHTNVARIMVLAAYAVGYNLLFGYTGLMSLGHAMFFAAGMYGAGLGIYYLGFGAFSGFALGVLAALVLAALFGLFALVVAVTTAKQTPLAAIFLVIAALPWGFVLTWIVDATGIESLAFNYAFMAAGVAVNAAVLYALVSWLRRRGE